MGTYDMRTGDPADEAGVLIAGGLNVARVVVKHGEVSFFDHEGRESVLIQRLTHPGAGLDVNFADHVLLRDTP